MRINKIQIKDYRNYKSAFIEPNEGLNLFIGANAQGKTNLLEAVYFCSVGKSARTSKDKELIRQGQQRAYIDVQTQAQEGKNDVKIIIDRQENKRIAINSMPISRMGELMGVVPSVFFSPAEIKVVNSSPVERRAFMDIALCQMSKNYFYLLQRYNKILSQRNRLLKGSVITHETLDVWDMQLADNGAKIVKSRKGYIKRLLPLAAENHQFLTDGAEQLSLVYSGVEGESVEEIRQQIIKLLQQCREKDIQTGFTNVGPQKDDIKIMIGDMDARTYGSQGQLRTAALSLKLAEADLYKSESGESPVLLLDDVLSELDKNRQNRLIQRASTLQTILTLTHTESDITSLLDNKSAIFIVEGGKVRTG